MISATNATFCSDVTPASIVERMVFITHTILSISEAIAFVNERIFLAKNAISRITRRSSQALNS